MGTEDASEVKKISRPAISRLKREREQQGWTQSELAEHVGTTQINVSRWENHVTVPSPYYRQRLGELFGKSIQELGLLPASSEERDEEITTFSDTPDSYTSTPLHLSGTYHIAGIRFLQAVKKSWLISILYLETVKRRP